MSAFAGGRGRSLLGAAAVISVITLVSRVAGFARWLVFARTVGSGCVGDAYTTANQLPNVVFELVAGGMLAATMVPLVAGAARRGDTATLQATAGALLGWVLLLLVPAAVLAAVVSVGYADAMMRQHAGCGANTVELTQTMLVYFAPQILLYGIAVWASSLLAAYHRFVAAAIAPLASTIVVMASYLVFAAMLGPASERDPGDAGAAISRAGLLVLAGGTTLGVVVLAAVVVIPLRTVLRTEGVRVRPRLRFPDGLGLVARRLALAGAAGLASQQLAMVALTWIANRDGDRGTVTLFSWAFAVFAVPFAVLLAPIATSAFPRVSAAVEGRSAAKRAPAQDRPPVGEPSLHRLVDTSLRTTVLAAAGGIALLIGTAQPVALMFTGPADAAARSALAAALVAIAPGLAGYGILTICTRFLAAQRRGRPIAMTNSVGWLGAVAVAYALARTEDADRVVVALAAGVAVGLTIGGVTALVLTATGPQRIVTGMAGLVRPVAAGGIGAALGAIVGMQVADVLGRVVPGLAAGLIGPCLAATATAVVVAVVYGVAVALVDRPDARRLVVAVLSGRRSAGAVAVVSTATDSVGPGDPMDESTGGKDGS